MTPMSRSLIVTTTTLGAFCAVAVGAPIPGVTSVQDLINLNQGSPNDNIPQGGVVIDNLRFYDFTYANAGSNPPAASQIDVETAPSPVGTTGLEFHFDWVAAGGTSMTSDIGYKVSVVGGAGTIDQVGAFFDGLVPAGLSGPTTAAQVVETVRQVDGTPIGVLNLFNDGPGPVVDQNASTLAIVPQRTDLDVLKSIRVQSDASGTATISVVDNTFRVIPEPASLGLIGLGGLLLARRRR